MNDRSMPSVFPRPTSLPGAIACASIAAAIALSTGCAVRDSGPTSAATEVRLDRWGQIVELTPRDPNAAADHCWIIVTVAQSHTEYAGGGACDGADRRTAHQFEMIEDDVRIRCACVVVDHPG